MPSRSRRWLLSVSGGAATVLTLVLCWLLLSMPASDPTADGFVAGIAAAFGLLVGLAAFFVGVDTALLVGMTRLSTCRSSHRAVLQYGVATSLASVVVLTVTVLPLVAAAPWEPSNGLLALWVLLLSVGTLVTVAGACWTVTSHLGAFFWGFGAGTDDESGVQTE